MKRFIILLLPSLLSLETAARGVSLQIGATPRITLTPFEMGAGIVLIVCLLLSIWAAVMANKARKIADSLRKDFKELKMRMDWSEEAYKKQGGASNPKDRSNKGNVQPNDPLSQIINDMDSVLKRLSSIENRTNMAACERNKLSARMDQSNFSDPAPSPEINLSVTPSETVLYAQLDASNPKRLFNVSKNYDSSKHVYKITLKGNDQEGKLEIIEEKAEKVFNNSDCSRCCDFRVRPNPSSYKQTPGKARVNGDTAEVIENIIVSSK